MIGVVLEHLGWIIRPKPRPAADLASGDRRQDILDRAARRAQQGQKA